MRCVAANIRLARRLGSNGIALRCEVAHLVGPRSNRAAKVGPVTCADVGRRAAPFLGRLSAGSVHELRLVPTSSPDR